MSEPKRDWVEDFSYDNGRYGHKCVLCGFEFTGHKRRVICKECSTKADEKPAKITALFESVLTTHVLSTELRDEYRAKLKEIIG